jgi:hypothetical protein
MKGNIALWLLCGLVIGFVAGVWCFYDPRPDCPGLETVQVDTVWVCDEIKRIYSIGEPIGYWIHTDSMDHWITGIENKEGWRRVDTLDLDTTCYRRDDCERREL